MDVRYTAEQHALRDAAAQVVDHLAPKAVGQLDDPERRSKLDAAVASTGWRDLRVPADHGEPWASGVEVAIVAEELSRGLADTPFLGPTLAAELRRLADAPSADAAETIALRGDLSRLAHPDEPAVAIDAADAQTVLAVGSDGTLWVFELATDLSDESFTWVDLTRPSRTTVLTAGVQIGTLAPSDLTAWTALALATTAAELVGVMQGALDLSTEYAKQRSQYGVAIGSFQAVAHLLAEALVHLEGSRTALLYAAWAVDVLDPGDALAAAASAKAYASRAAQVVCETAIQVHGGIGNTWECLAHVQLRRALLSTDVLGGVGPNLDRVLDHAGLAYTGRAV